MALVTPRQTFLRLGYCTSLLNACLLWLHWFQTRCQADKIHIMRLVVIGDWVVMNLSTEWTSLGLMDAGSMYVAWVDLPTRYYANLVYWADSDWSGTWNYTVLFTEESMIGRLLPSALGASPHCERIKTNRIGDTPEASKLGHFDKQNWMPEAKVDAANQELK